MTASPTEEEMDWPVDLDDGEPEMKDPLSDRENDEMWEDLFGEQDSGAISTRLFVALSLPLATLGFFFAI